MEPAILFFHDLQRQEICQQLLADDATIQLHGI